MILQKISFGLPIYDLLEILGKYPASQPVNDSLKKLILRSGNTVNQVNVMDQFYKLNNLTGFNLNADDGEIGKLEEILFDDLSWTVRYFIVSTGSWLMQREVLISSDMVTGVNEESKTLEVSLTREQVKNSPPVNTKLPVSRHYEQEYYEHYGKEPYWSGNTMFNPSIYVTQPIEEKLKKPGNPHLRSSNVVKAYSICASDGDIGQAEDFILKKKGWKISYLELNTGKWLPGKHVLVAPTWIRHIDWAKQVVTVDLNCEAIETAPFYDPSKAISQEYQTTLFKHYGLSYEEEINQTE